MYMTAGNRWEKKRSFGMGKKYMISNNLFYIFRVWRTSRKDDSCNEWLYRFFCWNVIDVLFSAERCKMKTVNVGSYPQHIARWFDTDCQEVKQELRKCFRYFRKSKTNAEHIKAYWWWLFLAYEVGEKDFCWISPHLHFCLKWRLVHTSCTR